jgi:hypothetical protein
MNTVITRQAMQVAVHVCEARAAQASDARLPERRLADLHD